LGFRGKRPDFAGTIQDFAVASRNIAGMVWDFKGADQDFAGAQDSIAAVYSARRD